MKKIFLSLSICSILFLSSCVFSLFPIYTQETLVEIPEFEGEWTNENGDQIIVKKLGVISEMSVSIEPGEDDYIIQKGDTIRDRTAVAEYYENELKNDITSMLGKKITGYEMTIKDNEDSIKYRVHLANIGSSLFLDQFPYDEDIHLDNGSVYMTAMKGNFIPVHSFMKIEISPNELRLISFDLDKMQKLFRSNKIRLRHEEVDDLTIITAKPEEIQKFLSVYADRKDVFESPEVYRKISQ